MIDNIKSVMKKTEELEEKIKMKEKIIKLGAETSIEESKRLTDYKIDAIMAKLALLDNLSTFEN